MPSGQIVDGKVKERGEGREEVVGGENEESETVGRKTFFWDKKGQCQGGKCCHAKTMTNRTEGAGETWGGV